MIKSSLQYDITNYLSATTGLHNYIGKRISYIFTIVHMVRQLYNKIKIVKKVFTNDNMIEPNTGLTTYQ